MCYIGNFYKTRNTTEEDLNFVVDGLYKKSVANPDGFGLVAYSKDGNVLESRKMKFDHKLILKALKKYNVVHVHLRMATTGSKCLDNVHMFGKGAWRFSHNGIVSGKVRKAEALDTSDSKEFFELLVRKDCLKDNGQVAYRRVDTLAKESGFISSRRIDGNRVL